MCETPVSSRLLALAWAGPKDLCLCSILSLYKYMKIIIIIIILATEHLIVSFPMNFLKSLNMSFDSVLLLRVPQVHPLLS